MFSFDITVSSRLLSWSSFWLLQKLKSSLTFSLPTLPRVRIASFVVDIHRVFPPDKDSLSVRFAVLPIRQGAVTVIIFLLDDPAPCKYPLGLGLDIWSSLDIHICSFRVEIGLGEISPALMNPTHEQKTSSFHLWGGFSPPKCKYREKTKDQVKMQDEAS